MDSILPWYSPETPKPMYESPDEQAYWDFPVYADHTCVKANRVDARLVDYKGKKVWAAEGRSIEAIHRLYIYNIEQCNIVIDELGEWSKARTLN